jgi:hypothetical protein
MTRMNANYCSTFLAVAVLAGGLVSFTVAADDPPAAGQPKAGAERREAGAGGGEFRGVIDALDAAAGTITVTKMGDGGPMTRTFNLAAKNLKVSGLRGEAAKLAELGKGTRVRLQLSTADDVVAIDLEPDAPGASARRNLGRGTVKAVDAERGTLELTVPGPRDGQSEVKSFAVGKDLRVAVQGGRGSLADLKPGTPLVLVFTDPGRQTLREVRVIAPEGEGRPAERREAPRPTVNRLGIHFDVPAAALADQLDLPEGRGIVVLEVPGGSPAERAGIKAHDVLLEINGQPVPRTPRALAPLLEGIRPGAAVNVVLLRKGKRETIQGVVLP